MHFIDNVLPHASFMRLKSYVMGPDFRWFYKGNLTTHEEEDSLLSPGFSFVFYNGNDIPDPAGYELAFSVLASCCQSVDHDLHSIVLARAFMTLPHSQKRPRQIHNDLQHQHQVCLYFLTDHDESEEDAKTYFYAPDGTVINAITPKANSAVVFDGMIPHSGGVSDKKRRVVINIDYMLKTPATPEVYNV